MQLHIKVVLWCECASDIFRRASYGNIFQWQPDVLLNGISSSKEDGYTLIHQVRTLAGERGKAVPAIALTGAVTEDMYQRSLLAGFSLCFAKPVVIDDFVAVLGILAIADNLHLR
ncbi:hypothetical protein H6G93_19435 [Nostoc sp. FACHB-973]|nr:hypothetical protein [Nostoc sp. FACHB-973]